MNEVRTHSKNSKFTQGHPKKGPPFQNPNIALLWVFLLVDGF